MQQPELREQSKNISLERSLFSYIDQYNSFLFIFFNSDKRARLVSTNDNQGSKTRTEETKPSKSPDRVIVDPSKGGAVEAKAAQQSKALEVHPGVWVWDGVVKVLEVDLFSPAWEVRHGAAMALREILKTQGKCGGMRGNVPSPFLGCNVY